MDDPSTHGDSPRSLLLSLLLSFYLPALTVACSQGMLIPVLPLYAKGLGTSYVVVGLVLAAEGLGMLLGDVPAGMLLRRLGRKGAMLVGLLCTMLSTAALFWTTSAAQVIACRLVAGFGTALYGVSRHAYIAAAVRADSRGRALSLLGGIFRVGRFAGPMIGGLLAGQYGLRVTFLAFGGLFVLALGSVAGFVRSLQPVPGATAQPSASSQGLLLTTLKAHYQVLVSAGVGYLLSQVIRTGRLILVPLYAADVLGLDVGVIGLLVGISSAVDMSLFYPAGLIMDRVGRKFAIVPCFVIQSVGMLLLPLTGDFWGLLSVVALMGFGNGLGSGVMMTLGADLAPPHSQGEFLGLWRLVGDVGCTAAPLVVGGVADLMVLQAAVLVISAAGLAAAAVFILLVPETLKKAESVVERVCKGG